jgi:hypothetical protein
LYLFNRLVQQKVIFFLSMYAGLGLHFSGKKAPKPAAPAAHHDDGHHGNQGMPPLTLLPLCIIASVLRYCTVPLVSSNRHTIVVLPGSDCERNVFSDGGEEHLKEDLSNLEQLLSKPSWIEKQFGS